MNKVVFLPLFAMLSVFTLEAQDFDVDQFIRDYKSTMKAVKTITYDMNVESVKGQFSAVIRIDKGRGYNDHRFLFLGSYLVRESGQKINFGYSDDNAQFMTTSNNGQSLDEMDLSQVQVYDKFGDALMSLNPFMVGTVINGPYTQRTATGVIMAEDKVTYKGIEVIEGKECIRLDLETAKGNKTYFIGKEDHLLHQYRSDKLEITYSIHETNQKFEKDDFDLSKELGLSTEKGGVLAVGQQAPAFELLDIEGNKVSSADFEGRLMVLDFWGTWCKPCLEEIPELNKLHAALKELEVPMLSISSFEKKTTDELIDFVSKRGIAYPVLSKGDEVAKSFKLDTYPTLVVVGPEGKILLTKGSNGSHDNISFSELLSFIKSSM